MTDDPIRTAISRGLALIKSMLTDLIPDDPGWAPILATAENLEMLIAQDGPAEEIVELAQLLHDATTARIAAIQRKEWAAEAANVHDAFQHRWFSK